MKNIGLLAIATIATLCLSACNPAPDADDSANASSVDKDPLEGFNRAMFEFNHALDVVILKPVALGYRAAVPEKGRNLVTNAVNNIYEPLVFANSVLQTDPQNSFATLWRFMINSTFGIGGLFDVASEIGLKNHKTDLGQTFAIYGIGEGPYTVLPILGPSNTRDSVGRLGDLIMNPVTYADSWVTYGVFGITLLDKRTANLKLVDDLYAGSLDPYTTFRSAYLQNRRAAIKATKAERKKSIDKAFMGPSQPASLEAPVVEAPKKPAKKAAKKVPAAVVAPAVAPVKAN